jgi:[ribosomal protein S5]-alanine N-acetyltransferase
VYFLETARLGFRRWRPDDLALANGLWGDPEVTRFIGGPLSPVAVADRLAAEIPTEATAGIQYWPIFQLEDGAHVGARNPSYRLTAPGR